MASTLQQWASRKRVLASVEHKEPDRVPIDLGGTICSGIMEEFFEVKKVFSHNRTERGLVFHCIATTQLKDFKVVTNSGKTNNLAVEVNLINANVVQLRMIPSDFYYKKQSDIVKVTNVPSFEIIETPQSVKLKTSVDFTNQRAKDWYKAQLIRLLKSGADVFKTDFGEEIPEDAVFSNGKTGKEMHNIYSLLYNKTVFELTKEHTGNGLVWGRSAYSGSQQYPTNWSGDPQCTFEDMASVLIFGILKTLSFEKLRQDFGMFGSQI